MRSSSYGALDTQVVESDPERGDFYPTSHGNLLRVPNENQEASVEESLLQNAVSLPTVIFSETDSQGHRSIAHKSKKSRGHRSRKETWGPGDRKKAVSSTVFNPMAFVAPPHIFPAASEISVIEREEEQRRRSTASKTREKSGVDDERSSGVVDSEKVEAAELPKLTRKEIFTIVMLAIANFASTVVFSCIAPFFPDEAARKGASQTVIGLIFGVFELVIFATSPIYGRYMTRIGSKRMYAGGMLVTGVTAICFGLLNLLPAGNIFIGMCFAVRMIEACSDAAFITASFAIIAHEFPGRTSTIIGLLETFSGLGFTVGPPIGGALYQLGGYQTPFIVLGTLLILAAILAAIFIPKQDDAPRERVGGMFSLFRFPAVWLMLSAIFMCAVGLTFIDPTFENHLDTFNLGPLLVGLMFLAIGGTYTLTAPVWGYFIDKTQYSREVMIFGALITMVGMFFLGPSPMFHIDKVLWVIVLAEIALGLGIGALFIPTFQNVLNIASGFFGPTIFGGAVAGAIGFSWTATVLAFLNLFVGITLIIYQVYNRFISKKTPVDGPLMEEGKETTDETKIGEGKVTPDSGMALESSSS